MLKRLIRLWPFYRMKMGFLESYRTKIELIDSGKYLIPHWELWDGDGTYYELFGSPCYKGDDD